jgi:hypothetical protein
MTDYKVWLGEQIEAHAPENTEDPQAAFRLVEACAAFGAAAAQAFGMTIPDEFEGREEVKTLAIETLKRWLPKLDGEARERLKKLVTEYRLAGS